MRVDINRNGKGCHTVWRNTTHAAPTAVSKLALATGLVYTYTKGSATSTVVLDRARLPHRAQVYKQLAGTGVDYNNNYAGIALARNGTEYVGTLGGVVAMRDG